VETRTYEQHQAEYQQEQEYEQQQQQQQYEEEQQRQYEQDQATRSKLLNRVQVAIEENAFGLMTLTAIVLGVCAFTPALSWLRPTARVVARTRLG
jgi:hypothetical protein